MDECKVIQRNGVNKIYKKITDSVKSKIQTMDIVFPAEYGKLYVEAANINNITLPPDKLLVSELLDEKMVRHVITLSECADQAIEAIQDQNLMKLQNILNETNILRDEIEELKKIIYQDDLTKSHNRKWLKDMYLHEDNSLLRKNGTLVVIDLDAFKAINDTCGHVVGDKILIHIALKLKETGGEVVRYGGDEFLIIFNETELSSMIKEKIDSSLRYFKKKSFRTDKESFKVSYSYGIAAFTVGMNIDDIIHQADKEMYKHKNSSRPAT